MVFLLAHFAEAGLETTLSVEAGLRPAADCDEEDLDAELSAGGNGD
jgi:hypothetical protein